MIRKNNLPITVTLVNSRLKDAKGLKLSGHTNRAVVKVAGMVTIKKICFMDLFLYNLIILIQ